MQIRNKTSTRIGCCAHFGAGEQALAGGASNWTSRRTGGAVAECGWSIAELRGCVLGDEVDTNFLLDGMDNNQVSDNLVAYSPSPDAIQECK